VLATERAARVGHDHAHGARVEPERLYQLLAHALRILRAGPDGEAFLRPLGYCGARLERGVLDVGDVVALAQHARGALHRLLGRATPARTVAAAAGALFRRGGDEPLEEFVARGMGRRLPLRGRRDARARGPRRERSGRREADEGAVARRDHVLFVLHDREIDRLERRAVRRRAQHDGVEHSGERDVGREAVRSRDDLARRDEAGRAAEHFPLRHAHDLDVRRHGVRREVDAVELGELRVRERTGRGQKLVRRGARGAHRRHGRGRGATAVGAAVLRHEPRVGEEHAHALERDAQILGGRHRDLRARSLADLDLAAQHRDRPVGAEVQPRSERLGLSAAALLRPGRGRQRGEHEAGAEELEELAAAELETPVGLFRQLVALGLERRLVARHRGSSRGASLRAASSTASRMRV